jgi:hypothetical protein
MVTKKWIKSILTLCIKIIKLIKKGNIMKINKFKMLGVATVLVAAGFNVQHAEAAQYGTPVQQEQKVEQTEKLTIFNLVGKVIKKSDPVEKKEVEVVDKGTVSSKLNDRSKQEDVSNNSEPNQSGNILLKAWEGTKNVTSNLAEKGKESFLAAKAKADAENEKRQAQPKVVEARGPNFGQVSSEDVVKAKDKVVGGISNLLGKLRAEPTSENTNKVKPN